MKEFVPDKVNPAASLQELIDGLAKYTDSRDLTVAVHLNKTGQIKLSELDFSKLRLGELWFFGAHGPGQEKWTVMGDLLKATARFHEFTYPGV